MRCAGWEWATPGSTGGAARRQGPGHRVRGNGHSPGALMEVILRQAVDKLGHPGDIVKVSAGYARNFLLARGIAYEATPGNKKRIAQEKDRLQAAENTRVTSAQGLAGRPAPGWLTFSA